MLIKQHCSDNDVQSDKETDDSALETPVFRIGRLVEFHLREDQTRVYTIRWDHQKSEGEEKCGKNSDLKSQSESRPDVQSESSMTSAHDSSIEQWTESRVTDGILLHKNLGLKVAKRFGTENFVGQVTDVYNSGNETNEVFYHIMYEDGDEEDFNLEELRKGTELYRSMQIQRRRRNNQRVGVKVKKNSEKRSRSKDNCRATKSCRKNKKSRLNEDLYPNYGRDGTSQSFGALYYEMIPIHTLILGTFPGNKSLRDNRYFSHPCNAFWWIVGDCLGFRRDRGEKKDGGLMKLCAHLRYDETYIVSYDKQVNILCQHGFALWDIIASCQRTGSLDSAIHNDEPNDIQKFVEQHPTISTIALANGKSGLTFFVKYFSDWLESGKLILHNQKVAPQSKVAINAITLISAPSVSPAAATVPFWEKRDFWETFVFAPGLKLEQKLATTKNLKNTSSSVSIPSQVIATPKAKYTS